MLLVFCITMAFANVDFRGWASYYGDQFVGRRTASGEIYEHDKLTCAHPSLPFGTRLKVTNTHNNKSIIVTVNDRGPFHGGRVIDLSKFAAEQLGFIAKGKALVEVDILDEIAPETPATESETGNNGDVIIQEQDQGAWAPLLVEL